MKLYTEEQVKEIIDIAEFNKHLTHDDILKEFSPIELPSDEEIREKSLNKFMQSNARVCFEEGAKWMKSKILGNNHLGGITY